MSRTRNILVALLVVVSGAAGFLGGWFGARAADGDPGTTIAATITEPPPQRGLTDAEWVWCYREQGYLVWSAAALALEGVPDLSDAEWRGEGPLSQATLTALWKWGEENPALYARACRASYEIYRDE